MRLEVGHIGKVHGLRGEVVVTLTTDRHERVEPGAELHAGDALLTVETARPHQQKFLVKFNGIDDREDAMALRGTALFAEPLDDPNTIWVHDLVGKTVVDGDGGQVGTVDSVEANPASDLLVLEDGLLIPLVFCEVGETVITVDPPDGLLDGPAGPEDDET